MALAANLLGMELGSLADWVAAVAAAFAAWFGVQALKTSREANATAEQAREDAQAQAEREQARELERDRRAVAGSLQAWWVTDQSSEKARWGVILSNASPVPSVFHDVELEVKGNKKSSQIRVATAPPGQYFIESNKESANAWEFPRAVADPTALTPLAKSSTHTVTRITFTDQLGTRWCWTAKSGLEAVG